MRSFAIILTSLILTDAWLLAAESKPSTATANNLLESCVFAPATDAWEATVGLAQDGLGYLLATPRGLANLYVYFIGHLRELPVFGRAIFDGDPATLEACAKFSVTTAASVFALYAAVAALNLLLVTVCATKDYFKDWLLLPSESLNLPIVGSVNIPAFIGTIFGFLQRHFLDPLINWEVDAFMIPLNGHEGKPTVGNVVTATSAAMSAAMLLACTPAVLSLMTNGANKEQAEAIAWTVGTALGLQYLAKLVA